MQVARGNRRKPLWPPLELLSHSRHLRPVAVDELVYIDPALLILTNCNEVERVWTGRSIAALPDAIEMVDPDGEDAITVKQ